MYRDVRALTADVLARDGVAVDVICGGFPCQDVSLAGKKVGIDAGKRSRLWSEYARLIREVRPRLAIVENVTGLLMGGGLGRVLGDLAEARYDAEWCVLSAAGVGASHVRERVFVIAFSATFTVGSSYQRSAGDGLRGSSVFSNRESSDLSLEQTRNSAQSSSKCSNTGDGRLIRQCENDEGTLRLAGPRRGQNGVFVNPHQPFLGREVHGLPRGMDGPRKLRIKQLGNSVVPQVAEQLGWMILDGGFLRGDIKN